MKHSEDADVIPRQQSGGATGKDRSPSVVQCRPPGLELFVPAAHVCHQHGQDQSGSDVSQTSQTDACFVHLLAIFSARVDSNLANLETLLEVG